MFSCNEVITPFLRETLQFLGLDQKGVSIDAAIPNAMSYFRWRYGLEYVRPVKKMIFPWPKNWQDSYAGRPSRIRYQSRRLCCNITTRRQMVEMLNLDTGERSNPAWSGPGKVDHITLSDRYLVMTWPAT